MELHCSQTQMYQNPDEISLSTLWNYTALKRQPKTVRPNYGLSTLWNYTALKQGDIYSC